jgi:hypothetical protein
MTPLSIWTDKGLRRPIRTKTDFKGRVGNFDANRHAIGGILRGRSLQMQTSKSQQPFGLEKNGNSDPAPLLSHGLHLMRTFVLFRSDRAARSSQWKLVILAAPG